ncbi:ribonuclease H-like domain-containing protein [Lentinula raphanica]|nr:ribonuclease H-like domain-containing protein [Lentinula raphanica]
MRAEAQLRVDHLIIRLICARGLVPEILDSPEWQELLKTMNPKIKVKSSKVFRDELIPKEAIFVRQEQHKALSEISNLTCSFDGTNIRRKDTFYTVHAITPSREAYLLDGAQGASENHTAEWVKGKIIPIMKSIGVANWAGCVSDSTSTTAKVRAGIAEEIPTVVNLDDCVHLLHNMIGDISKLAAFKEPLNIMKQIAKYFSKSGLATNRLLEYRRAQSASNAVSDKVLRIQKPGGTRFGSLHTSAMSLLPNLPAIQSLVADKQIKFLNVSYLPIVLHLASHHSDSDLEKFRQSLHAYTTIIDPVIRALWSLEAADANASDVFVFWLAIAGYLDEMMKRPEGATGIPANVTPEVKSIYNTRYNAFFSNDLYFVAFLLDPRYSSQDFLKPNLTITIPSTQPHQNPSVSQQSAALRTPFPDAYERLKEVLKKLLRDVLYLSENDSDECRERLFGECSKVAIADSLKTQVEDFWYGRRPFNAPLSQRTSPEWWRRLQRESNANVLAFLAIKIFSISVNSMTDERTNSYITWLNSPLRGNQLVGTLIDMIQVGQWYRKVCQLLQSQRNTN